MRRHSRVAFAVRASAVVLAVWSLAAWGAVAAEPADVEGARDHRLFPRYPGASVYDFTAREREVAAFGLDGGRVVQVDGRYLLARYRHPPGITCATILGRSEASLREAKLRVYRGTSLPEEAARSLGAPVIEGWVAAVGSEPDGLTIHALAACSAGGISAVGHVLVVESKPLTMRGRGAPHPAFDTAPQPQARAVVAQDPSAEVVFRCAPRVKVQVGPVTPVELVEDVKMGVSSSGTLGWAAHFAPAVVTRSFVLSGSAIAEAEGELVCRYKGEGDLADQSMTMTHAVPTGRTCVRRAEAEEFRCSRR